MIRTVFVAGATGVLGRGVTARLVADGVDVRASTRTLRSQRVSNRRLRAATGWAPQHADVVDGWRALARARSGAERQGANRA